MATFVNPFTDFGFKRIFGQEDTKRLLMGFLNALFEGEFVITDLTYLDKEQLGYENKKYKGIIYDILCRTDKGEDFILEMQNRNQSHFQDRALYYMCRRIIHQRKRGEKWNYRYPAVYGIFLMNFTNKVLKDAFYSSFSVRNDDTNCRLTDKLRMVFLQLPIFKKTEKECTTNLDKWTYIIKNMNTLKEIPWKEQDELFEELSKVSNVAALTPQERIIYEHNLKVYWDNNAVQEAAYDDGHEAGLIEGIKKTALSLMQHGFADDMISTITGLSLDDIKELRKT